MGRMGKFDCKGLEEFQRQLEGLQGPDKFMQDCAKELAARLLAKVIKRTPVGDYSKEIEVTAKRNSKKHKKGEKYKKKINQDGKTGGTLRRGWTGGEKASAKEYVDSLAVHHFGDTYVIEIVNPVEYASYVEYGHRQSPGRYVPALGKRLKRGWVKGRFMMTISEQELQLITPRVLENRIKKYFEGCLK